MKPVVFPMIRCPDVWGAGMDAGRCPHPSLPLTTCARRNLAGGLPKGTAPGLILFAQVLLYLAATASLACSSTSGVAGSSITWRSYISDRARLYSLGKTLTNLEPAAAPVSSKSRARLEAVQPPFGSVNARRLRSSGLP